MANHTPFDEMGNEDIEMVDILRALVLDYLQTVNSLLIANFEKLSLSEVLSLMDLLVGRTERQQVKNVAVMMFCMNPNNKIEVLKIVGPVLGMNEQVLTRRFW